MKYIHACNLVGLENLLNEDKKETYIQNGDYLCCSSIECNDFLHKEFLIMIDGIAARKFDGDIGSIGMNPKNTEYDEIHVEGEFEVLGLYVVDNNSFDLFNYAKAIEYCLDILEINIELINATTEQKELIDKYREEIQNLSDNEWNKLFEIE